MKIKFSLTFTTEEKAQECAERLKANGFTVKSIRASRGRFGERKYTVTWFE